MQRGKIFLVGMLVGGLLFFGVGYTRQAVQVMPQNIKFIVNGQEVNTGGQFFNGKEYVPTAFIYQGTTYVPVRFLAEMLQKEVKWEGERMTITINDKKVKEIPFKSITLEEAPPEIAQWVKASLSVELAQRRDVGDKTYLLVTRGVKPTGGYGVAITRLVQEGESYVAVVQYSDPAPDAVVIQVLTCPYTLIETGRLEGPVCFRGDTGQSIPQRGEPPSFK